MPRDKCPQESCGSLEVQVAANLNSIHSLNEASRGEEQGFVISRRWLWVPASSAGLGSSSQSKAAAAESAPARTSPVHGEALQKLGIIGLGDT